MKYLVPPVIIPIVLVIAIAAYALLKPPAMVAHLPAAAANVQPR